MSMKRDLMSLLRSKVMKFGVDEVLLLRCCWCGVVVEVLLVWCCC